MAIALIALWLSHLIAFAMRSTRAMVRKTDATSHVLPTGRRRFLVLFAQNLAFAALATIFTAGKLQAQGCNCYTDANCNCRPPFTKCVYNPTTGEAICCGPNTNGCAGPTQTWCCPPGSSVRAAAERASVYRGYPMPITRPFVLALLGAACCFGVVRKAHAEISYL